MDEIKASEEVIKKGAQQIGNFLKRSFNTVSVNYVDPKTVSDRTVIGFDAEKALKESPAIETYYRVKINNVKEDSIFEDEGTMKEHIKKVIEQEMEQNSPAPDTIWIEDDSAPKHLEEPYVFYVRSVL